VANNRNRNGEVYGFVRYAKVRDVDKLLKAVNNVCFGQYCVRAVLARFDRKRERRGVEMSGGVVEGEKKEGGGRRDGEGDGVRVGSVLVKVRDRKQPGEEGDGGENGAVRLEGHVGRLASTDKSVLQTRLLQKYRSCEEDFKWVTRGLIGTVTDGTAIPIIQNRVEDAGFKDIDVIPLGADKVFVHSLSGANVTEVVNEARPFFDLIFSSLIGWTKDVMPFQRGAWLRLYGIPIHAWNENFFKLCVFDCGRYLRTDNCSLNRERFDYARVLIATSSIEIVNVSEQLLIDGAMVSIKITEEWGFNFGDDVCLYDEDDKSTTSSQGNVEIRDDFALDDNVVEMVDKIVNDLVHADVDGMKMTEVEPTTSREVRPNVTAMASSSENCVSAAFTKGSEMDKVGITRTSTSNGGYFEAGDGAKENEESALRIDEYAVVHRNSRHASSQSSEDDRTSIRLGPWSVDWLQNIQKGDIGLISSKHKRLKRVRKNSGRRFEGQKPVVKRIKAGGVLRHPVMTLKKVARLPSTDKAEVMKVLQGSKALKVLNQKVQKRRRQRERVTRSLDVIPQSSKSQSTSSASVNNDWTNWVALNGSDESKVADVQAIGKTLGISFTGTDHNTFSVLARPKGVTPGPVLNPVEVVEGVVDGGA